MKYNLNRYYMEFIISWYRYTITGVEYLLYCNSVN